jgi:membrane protein required for colicin V production
MSDLPVNTIDIVVIAVILISAFLALWRGLVRETFSIFEWVASAYVALRFAPVFQPMLIGIGEPPWLAWIAAFVGTFIVVLVPLSMLTHRFADIVKRSEIGPVDRALGFVFGIGRGLVVVGLAYIAFASFVPREEQPAVVTDARLFPLIQNSSQVLLSLLPGTENEGKGGEGGTVSQGDTAETKTYGAQDRGALDRLFEATGRSQSSSR